MRRSLRESPLDGATAVARGYRPTPEFPSGFEAVIRSINTRSTGYARAVELGVCIVFERRLSGGSTDRSESIWDCRRSGGSRPRSGSWAAPSNLAVDHWIDTPRQELASLLPLAIADIMAYEGEVINTLRQLLVTP